MTRLLHSSPSAKSNTPQTVHFIPLPPLTWEPSQAQVQSISLARRHAAKDAERTSGQLTRTERAVRRRAGQSVFAVQMHGLPGGMVGVLAGVQAMAVREVRMMARSLVVSRFCMLCRFAMMLRG